VRAPNLKSNRIERTSWNTRLFNRLPIWRWWNWPPALRDLHRHRSPTGHPKSNSMVTSNFFYLMFAFTYFTFLRHVGKKVMCFALWWFFVSIFGTAARDVNRNRPSTLSCKLHQTVFPNPPTPKNLNFSISSSQREFQMF
jgi:hypothetical protein